MTKLDNFIVKSIEEIKSDVKSIYARLDVITQDIHCYKNQKYKCQADCDLKYLRLTDIESIFKRELDKYYEQKHRSTHRKTEIIKNIVHIILALAPYVAIVSTYLLLTQQ